MSSVSVIMPVYNSERFVAEATETVLAQTFGDFEFIVIDDGSTDRSRDILEGFARRDPRVLLVSRPNKGLVATLNEGLALARSPLIARMDADDLCHSQRFELQVKALNEDPALVAVGCCAGAIDEDGHRLGNYSRPGTLTHEGIEAWHLRGDQAIHHPSVMFRAAAVRALAGYRDLAVCEDFDLFLRLGEIGRLANLPETLLTKRLYASSFIATRLDKRPRVLEQIMAEAWRRRSLPGDPPRLAQTDTHPADLLRAWSWMALKEGHLRTSRRYALKAMKAQPLRVASWRVMAHSLRGR